MLSKNINYGRYRIQKWNTYYYFKKSGQSNIKCKAVNKKINLLNWPTLPAT